MVDSRWNGVERGQTIKINIKKCKKERFSRRKLLAILLFL